MGASTIPSTYLLPELLPACKKLCPETYFNIHQSDSQGILDKILEGSFNLGEDLILREEGSGSRKFVCELLEKLNIPESSLQITARLNDQESIKNLVANGLGISVISKAAACSPGSDQKLLVFDLPLVADSRSLYLVYHKNFILKPYVHHFMEFVINFYTRSRY